MPSHPDPEASVPAAAADEAASPAPAPAVIAFEAALLADWARRGWHPSASALLLCVSGGADSIALLRCFHRLAPRLSLRLFAAHIDHRLRPESPADAAFVAGTCAALGVPLHSFVLDPAARAPRESVEMWARRERYLRFERAAAACGATAILTAHHRDDLVETVFQRLGRGTGPRGLAGIPFRRGSLVRPLLDRPRAELLAYLRALGAPWREDASNADVTLDRNWYRHRYLPAVRAREPGLDARIAALADTVDSLRAGLDALEAEADLLRIGPNGAAWLDPEGLYERIAAEDHESLRYWLAALLRRTAPESSVAVTPEILREFLRQWGKRTDALCVHAGAGLAFARGNRGICCVRAVSRKPLARARAKKSCSLPAQRVILDGGSSCAEWRWNGRGYSLTARRFPRPAGLEFPASGEERAIFDADLISCTLLVRIRKDGDRFSPLGTHSRSRKLKTFFNEEKVPAALRDSLPIVVSCHAAGTAADGESAPYADEVPAWIPGYGISDFYKVRGSTSHILELVMKCENP